MYSCKNCKNEFEGKYCNDCGQEFIEKQTFRTFFKGFIDAFDINNKFLYTLKGIFITPGKLVRDYSEGNTSNYIGPLTMALISVTLLYFLSESNILGFSLTNSENEFQIFYKNTRAALIAGLIAGLLPFTAYNWVRFMTLSFYLSSGFLLLMNLVQTVSGFEWIYDMPDHFSSIISYLIFPYLLYFIFSVFKGHYRSLFIYLTLFISIEVFYEDLEYYALNGLGETVEWEYDALDNLYYQNNIPDWSYDKLSEINRNFYSQNILSDSSYFDIDINGDGVRDITAFLSDSLENHYMVTVSIKENQPQTIRLADLFNVRTDADIVAINTSQNPEEKFRVLYTDSSEYVIYWKDRIYGKNADSPVGTNSILTKI